MFIAELGHERVRPSSTCRALRTGVMAGSPCPVEVMKQCIDRMHMGDVTICYGMTETSPVSTQTLPDDSLEHQHGDGRAGPPARRDPHRRPVDRRRRSPRGETGEFCTRGYSVMTGYWNDPERTAAAIDADGWMHTGDLAVMADDGYVQHRRADQGHGDPRRRERLPARDRGVPLHPPRHRGRPGDRRARRAVRRGADGVGQAAPRVDGRPRIGA